MKKIMLAELLHFKCSPRLLLPASLCTSSAASAAESSFNNENHQDAYIASDLSHPMIDLINFLPINACAWLSLSAILAFLFYSKHHKPNSSHLQEKA